MDESRRQRSGFYRRRKETPSPTDPPPVRNAPDRPVRGPTAEPVSAAQAVGPFVIPTITNLSPTSGSTTGGTTVTITGSGFTGATAVRFGGNAAAFIFNSDSRITATAPAGTGTVQVTVITSGGTSNGFSYTYTSVVPTVTNLTPNSGPAAGGSSVTITGTNLSTASAVEFGTGLAAFRVLSDTQIVAITPAGAGAVQVRVTTPGGVSATGAASTYTYVAAPIITGLAPGNSGPASGGNTVTITGAGFTGTAAVRFGVNNAGFTVNSDGQITATAPAGPPGAVQITVTATGGTSAGARYFYISAPTVTGLSPNQGPTGGGNTVTITGTNFTLTTAVRFGASNATFTVINDGQITVVPPAGSGTVQATVTSPGGTSTISAASGYTYLAAPTISTLSPNLGLATGGTTVTVTGNNLTFTNAVSFGTSPASFSVLSDTQLTAITPPGNAGPVSVTVTTPAGTSAAATYTYVPAPG